MKDARDFISFQLSRPNFIPFPILWVCLFDGEDDDILHKYTTTTTKCCTRKGYDNTEKEEGKEVLERKIRDVLGLRSAILDHLIHVLNENVDSLQVCLPTTPSKNTVRSLLHTLSMLMVIRKYLRKQPPGLGDGITLVRFDDLMSKYYNLLFIVVLHTDISSFAHLMYGNVASQLADCENAVHACQMIDIISVLSSEATVKCSPAARELSWSLLEIVYTTNPDIGPLSRWSRGMRFRALSSLPHSFSQVMRNHFQYKNGLIGPLTALNKTAIDSSRLFMNCAVLRQSILAHWGQLVIDGYETYEDLSKLLEHLVIFLNNISPERKGGRNNIRFTQSRKPCVGGKGTGKAKSVFSTLPGLTITSFPAFFEIIMHLVIASFTICAPSNSKNVVCQTKVSVESQTSTEANQPTKPYRNIQSLSTLFGRMVEMFVSKNRLFPRRVFRMVMKGCMIMMKACEYQLVCCVDWRNKQPLVKTRERKKGVIDFASVGLLKPLIDNLASNCVGATLGLCKSIQDHVQNNLKGDNVEHTPTSDQSENGSLISENWANSTTQKTVTNLILRSEKLLDVLYSISSAHSLSPPNIEKSFSLRKQYTTVATETQQLGREKNVRVEDGVLEAKRKHVTPNITTEGTDRWWDIHIPKKYSSNEPSCGSLKRKKPQVFFLGVPNSSNVISAPEDHTKQVFLDDDEVGLCSDEGNQLVVDEPSQESNRHMNRDEGLVRECLEQDEGTSGSDDSFGVDGDWGDDTESARSLHLVF